MMLQLFIRSGVVLGLVVVSSVACTAQYQKLQPDSGGAESESGSSMGGGSSVSAGVPGFDEIYEQVLRKDCLSCHSTKLPLLRTYEETVANLEGILQTVVIDKSMPQRKSLSLTKITLVQRWIDAGAPREAVPAAGSELTPTPVPTTEPSSTPISSLERPVRFATLKEKVLEESCNSCHSEGGEAETVPMTTYDDFISVAPSAFGSSMYPAFISMPPQDERNLPPLDQSQREVFSLWILDGMQN